jgi:hypothetical protein
MLFVTHIICIVAQMTRIIAHILLFVTHIVCIVVHMMDNVAHILLFVSHIVGIMAHNSIIHEAVVRVVKYKLRL